MTTAFRSGWPRRRIELDIAGSDAVGLTLRSGRVFRIGTDQPAELSAAIELAQTA